MKYITPKGKQLIKAYYNKIIKNAERERDKIIEDVKHEASQNKVK
jgi:F0F1-type ATP synthase membrane subunit b/b'